ncbi:hypothetical protein HZS_3336 [Henneguya salminicola]|nr:hypothetical protein HZS_3336 [Henneguya salminicola]
MPYNYITPKVFFENYAEENSAKINLYPHDIYQLLLHQRCSQFHAIQCFSECYQPLLALKITGSLFFQATVNVVHSQSIPYNVNVDNNESIALLRYNFHTFIDFTFLCTPHSFYAVPHSHGI